MDTTRMETHTEIMPSPDTDVKTVSIKNMPDDIWNMAKHKCLEHNVSMARYIGTLIRRDNHATPRQTNTDS